MIMSMLSAFANAKGRHGDVGVHVGDGHGAAHGQAGEGGGLFGDLAGLFADGEWISRESFASTRFSSLGSSALKKSEEGYPSRLCQMALYPAVQELRISLPHSCQTTQSAASRKRSAFS